MFRLIIAMLLALLAFLVLRSLLIVMEKAMTVFMRSILNLYHDSTYGWDHIATYLVPLLPESKPLSDSELTAVLDKVAPTEVKRTEPAKTPTYEEYVKQLKTAIKAKWPAVNTSVIEKGFKTLSKEKLLSKSSDPQKWEADVLEWVVESIMDTLPRRDPSMPAKSFATHYDLESTWRILALEGRLTQCNALWVLLVGPDKMLEQYGAENLLIVLIAKDIELNKLGRYAKAIAMQSGIATNTPKIGEAALILSRSLDSWDLVEFYAKSC